MYGETELMCGVWRDQTKSNEYADHETNIHLMATYTSTYYSQMRLMGALQ